LSIEGENMRQKKIESEKVEALLKEYEDQRVALKLMIDDLEKIKVKVDTILPERLDNRFVRYFEEKIKTISALFQIVLDVRKEILKSIRDEVEVRTKINLGDDLEESLDDIRGLAKRVEKLQKEAKLLSEEQTKEETKDNKEERTEVLS
jgi:hypothetical protein